MIEQIRQLLNKARKEGNQPALHAYSNVISATQRDMGRTGKPVTEPQLLKIIKCERDMVLETLEFALASEEYWVNYAKRVDYLEALLPAQVPESEYKNIINSAFEEIKPAGVRDMGKVLKLIQEKYAGIDSGKVAAIVKEKLK